METARLTSKGQIVLPSSIRTARKWKSGTELSVTDTPEGVLLKPLMPFAPTRVDDVCGMLKYKGPRRTVAEMDAAIVAEAKRQIGK